MGNSDDNISKEKNIINILKNLQGNITNYIQKSFQNSPFEKTDDVLNWGNKVLKHVNNMFDSKINVIDNFINGIKQSIDQEEKISKKNIEVSEGKRVHMDIEEIDKREVITSKDIQEKKLEVITSKDIQEKNLEITREFEKFSINLMEENEKIENQYLGERLLKIANIARMAYNNSNQLLKDLYFVFEKKNKVEEFEITSNDHIKKEFSSWVNNPKNQLLKNQYIEKVTYENNLSFCKVEENKEIIKYYKNLFKDLLVLYFDCQLSFPPIEINFELEDDKFKSEKMIDYFKIGKNAKKKAEAKVNFAFFPSLFSNGNFLENGKQWVFKYIKNEKEETFFYKNPSLLQIKEKDKRFHIPKISDNLKLTLKKVYTPKLNYKISKDANSEFYYEIQNLKTKEKRTLKSDSSIELEENEEIINCNFCLMNEYISSLVNKSNNFLLKKFI